MPADLSTYLAVSTLRAEESASWLAGRIQLRIRGYLSDGLPPLEYVTSARCLVFRRSAVLVQRDRDSTHILPGGRRETGESPLETVRREVLEETGWRLADPALLGFAHFRHLTPEPPGYSYPYPDFVQVVYVADAVELVPSARLDDGYELESVFRSVADVQRLPLPPTQRLFLDAALQRRRCVTASSR